MIERKKSKNIFKNIFKTHDNGHEPNYSIMILSSILVIFGLLMLISASSVYSYKKFDNSYYMFWHQFLYGFLPGIVAFYFCSRFNYNKWKKLSFTMLFISIVLLLIVFVPGIGASYGKAHSWINIFGFSIQPSEIVKLTFLLYLSAWIESRGKDLKDLNNGLIPFLFILAIVATLMFLQPDLGTLSIIIVISFGAFFVGEANIKHIFSLVAGFIILFLISMKLAPYRLSRLLVFLHPNTDTQGIGYHLNQALIAVGSGGLFGLGLGMSRQKYGYLPEVAGDSIFGIIAEELGFFLCVIFIFLFFAFVYQGIKIAKNSKDKYAKILASGITIWIGFQAFINIASVIGLMPMTGVPLPLVSYGGTAMMINLAAIGILVNISKYTTR